MAQQTNTQFVAHEFVRQYYTILHRDPTQLHRFYTKESRLTHGGSPNAKSEEQAVCGQEAIYEKIAQLNFKNCFTKIRSVDSHPTLAGGVVIQVNGELSNSGMQYRKFMQTFVLAQKEPKKYNVFNDIFRYQDETFEDTENEETIDGTVESESGYQAYDCMQTTEVNNGQNEQEVPLIQNSEPLNDADNDYSYNGHIQEEDETHLMNGDVETDKNIAAEEIKPEAPVIEEPTYQEEEQNKEDIPEPEAVVEEAPPEVSEPPKPQEPEIEDKPQPDDKPKQFTWASLTKKNTVSTAPSVPPPQQKPAPQKVIPAQQPVQKKQEEAPIKKEMTEEPRRRTPAPDTHQIFIGNLPSCITEKDVRDNFNEFGNIVEVRLNPKNFGFIAFDSPDAPNSILNKPKSIVIHGNTINIEVKRSGGPGRERGGDRGGGFRRDRGSDKDRRGGEGGRSDYNKNSGNKNSGQFNRNGSGKNSFGGPKRNDDGKNDSGKGQKEQSKSRDFKNNQNRR